MVALYYGHPRAYLYFGDCIEAMRQWPECSVDAVVCDPPYALSFMGKTWDKFDVPGGVGADRNFKAGATGKAHSHGIAAHKPMPFQAWCEVWGREALRVLKPGGHLVAFGGSRTYHRLACALEDAGFEIRDSLMWLYGSGYPKSMNVSKAIDDALGSARQVVRVKGTKTAGLNDAGYSTRIPDVETAAGSAAAQQWEGWGTALKPAHEPIVLARKPLDGTVAANVQKWGTGALNIDGCRIGTTDNLNGGTYSGGKKAPHLPSDDRSPRAAGRYGEDGRLSPEDFKQPTGRWPANVMLDEEAGVLLDAQSGVLKSGGASRFFYCPKVSRAERDLGCETLPAVDATVTVERDPESAGAKNPRAGAARGAGAATQVCAKCEKNVDGGRAVKPCSVDGAPHEIVDGPTLPGVRNFHPTLKPIALMRWLVRLVTPPGGLVLDPFMGSGSTGVAALLEGCRFIGTEKTPEYLPIAAHRIFSWEKFNK